MGVMAIHTLPWPKHHPSTGRGPGTSSDSSAVGLHTSVLLTQSSSYFAASQLEEEQPMGLLVAHQDGGETEEPGYE